VPVLRTAAAVDVYKWTGEDGTTHFSQAPPRSDTGSLEVVEITWIPPSPDAALAPASYQRALELALRLQADRLAREQLRLEREALRLKKRAARLEEKPGDAAPAAAWYLPYYRYPRQRPFPPGHRPHRSTDKTWRPGQGHDHGSARSGRPQQHYRRQPLAATQQAQRTTGRPR
jgi:hypothetical protein